MSEYVPKPDLEGINSPLKQTPIKDSIILLAGFLAVLGICYFVLINASDWILSKVSLEQEIGWFKKISSIKENSAPPVDFTALLEKVKPHVPFDLDVSVVCSKDINAGAFPGGKIILTAGLLENIKSENGLVFVLGHEVGHIINRDHIRGLGRQIIFSLGAGLLGFEGISSLSMLNQTLSRVYDRNQESDADTFGLELSKKIYGHTWGSDELFEILEKDEGVFGRSMARLASTHPPSADRRERLKLSQIGPAAPLAIPARPFKEWVPEFGCKNL